MRDSAGFRQTGEPPPITDVKEPRQWLARYANAVGQPARAKKRLPGSPTILISTASGIESNSQPNDPADAWLTRTKTEVKDGIHTPDAESVTVAEAAELWLSRRKTRLLERGSLRTYSGYVTHILPLLGRMKLSRLTTPMVEAFADTLVKHLSWQRAGKVLSALKMILNNAQRRGLVAQNVALPVRMEEDERGERPLAVGVDVPTIAEMLHSSRNGHWGEPGPADGCRFHWTARL